MARDYAHTNTTIWQDADFRALPFPAQHLYMVLWTHPDLSYCGVLDWRPGRIAPLAGGWTADTVRQLADCLQARRFLVVDEDTEEVLIRSWVRWDGLMKQPRLAVSYAKAYASVASNTLRSVVVSELLKLREREPTLAGFKDSRVSAMFSMPAVSAHDLPPVTDPFGDGFTYQFGPSLGTGLGLGLGQTLGDVSVPPTPSPTPAPSTPKDVVPRKRGSRLPDGWLPDPNVRAAMAKERPDLDLKLEHEKFTDHWKAKAGRDGIKLDWDATWRNWIRSARPAVNGRGDRRLQPVPAYTTPPAPDPKSLPW